MVSENWQQRQDNNQVGTYFHQTGHKLLVVFVRIHFHESFRRFVGHAGVAVIFVSRNPKRAIHVR